jgi:hypothetical protein
VRDLASTLPQRPLLPLKQALADAAHACVGNHYAHPGQHSFFYYRLFFAPATAREAPVAPRRDFVWLSPYK